MFEQLTNVLATGFEAATEPVYLVGNAMFDDKEIDAVLLKQDALFVIEMKDYGGLIHFSETAEWFADEIEVRGGVHGNPYRQIRANKFGFLNFLIASAPNILTPPTLSQYWHIGGVVLFGRNIKFDEKIPQRISDWFNICDFQNLISAIMSFRTHGRILSPAELSRMLSRQGINDRHIYRGVTKAPVKEPTAEGTAPPPKRLQVLYYNQSNFRTALLALRKSSGRRAAAANRLLVLIQQAGAGINSFNALQSKPDARIENALIYTLNEEACFAAIQSPFAIHLCYCGTPADVEIWFQANAGLTLAVDADTLRIDSTTVTIEAAKAVLSPTQITQDNQPFLARIKGLELEDMFPSELIRENLLALDENSPEQLIHKVLNAVADEDVRLFLHDVLSLAKAGDIAGAEARVRLRKGDACPVTDAPGLTEQAVVSDANPDQVTDLADLDLKELERLFDQDFEKWMLHLHKDQESLAQADFDKPVVLTGVSGSGKTCILVHRARYLARKYPGERIAVLTLNRSLAALLQNLVNRLCLDGEAKHIHVMAFYDYFSKLLHELGPGEYLNQLSEQAPESSAMQEVIDSVNARELARELDPESGETTEDTWDDFFASQNPEVKEWFAEICHYLEEYRIDASRYLREEFTLVRSAFPISERTREYTSFERKGRSIQLYPKHRADILKLLLLFEEYMLAGEVLDVLELTLAVTPLWQQIRDLPAEQKFRCVLVDEFQDFSTLDLRLLMWAPPRDVQNALFLTGDPVQKILVKRLSLADAGLGGKKRIAGMVAGPVDTEANAIHFTIKKNYRNCRLILRAASKLANVYGELARKSGEEIEVLDPELAIHERAKPMALKTNNQVKKAWEIARQYLAEGETQAWTICIATASAHKYPTDTILAMRPAGLQADILSGEYIKNTDTVVVSTMNDLKGFEFNLVVIIGCDEGVCPASETPEGEFWRDALRFYVCMTRARDQVYMLYESTPSQFLLQMGNEIESHEEPLKDDYQPVSPQARSITNPRRMRLRNATQAAMPGPYDSCVGRLSTDALAVLRVYYDANVDDFKWHDCRGLTPKAMNDLHRKRTQEFNRWVTPANLAQLRARDFFRLRNVGKKKATSLNGELRAIGITSFFSRQ